MSTESNEILDSLERMNKLRQIRGMVSHSQKPREALAICFPFDVAQTVSPSERSLSVRLFERAANGRWPRD